mmetsp:Transcript_353/g.488  ORF Transcript_353/g.488 Transcript_353/m.488 type:complete len:83 (-) Transcript_353:120-368(-)
MLDVESYDSEVFSSGGSSEGSSSTAGSVIPSMELAASYPSEQAAKEAIELFGREHGFAVVGLVTLTASATFQSYKQLRSVLI